MTMLNPFTSPEQERLRELVSTMWREETPLAAPDLKLLRPFVRQVGWWPTCAQNRRRSTWAPTR